ncbi:MAG TPA: DegV family protein [Coriobacteriia bacterium]
MAVHVITDSTSAMPAALTAEFGIQIVSLSVTLGGVSESDLEIDAEAFYRRMTTAPDFPTSSQPALASMIEALEEPVGRGDGVVAVLISSKMSGTYESALLARDQILARHPGAVIEIVDSRSNSMEEGFAVLAAARVAQAGGTAAEAAAAARRTTERTRWLFTVAELDHLRMGGRIGNAKALLGSLLQIRPILTVVDGVTSTVKSVRTGKRALEEIAAMVAVDFEAYGFVDAVVHHVIAPREGEALADLIEQRTGHRPAVYLLPPAIGIHVGPGALGVVYEVAADLHKNTEPAL